MTYMKLTIFLILICLGACATTRAPVTDEKAVAAEKEIQLELAFDNLLKYQRQLDPIARPIMVHATAFCNDRTTRDIGVFVTNKYGFAEEYSETAAKRGIGNEPQVLWLADNGSAQGSGLQVDDRIIAIDEVPICAGRKAMNEYRQALHEQRANNAPLSLTILRNGREREMLVPSVPTCDYPVVAVLDLSPNAYADGKVIAVHSGLLRFYDRPGDIQVIIGHELAHNTMGHVGKGLAGWIFGTALDIVLGTGGIFGTIVPTAFSPGLEAEADYVGLYVVANAGVQIGEAERIWRELGAESGGDKQRGLLDTHPATPNRFVSLRATVKEIETKRANGEPLRPSD